MAEAFKTGDVVQLKSGGPSMTVVNYGNYSSTEMVLCKWFDGKASTPHQETFLEGELKAVQKQTSAAWG